MSLIEVKDLRVRFPHPKLKEVEILRGIDLTLEPGEIVTVVGESGCGKSTLGRVLLGLQKPSVGSVLYEGVDIHAPGFRWNKELRLMVSVVHQDSYASLNPLRTVGEILSAPLKTHRPKKNSRQAVQEILTDVGLTPPEKHFNAYSFQLSGGQRQRVALARAILLEPKLVVADEPISGVDAAVKLDILNLLNKFNQERGIGFLYITHDLATASLMDTARLLVLYLGQVVELGCLQDMLKAPAHPYLKALLSAVVPPDPVLARAREPMSAMLAENPDPARPPSGCLFHPRCAQRFEPCAVRRPELKPLNEGSREVACFLYHDAGAPSAKAIAEECSVEQPE